MRSRHIGALTLVVALTSGASTFAHRRDEYLQAARLDIHPDRVHIDLDLTPGIAVAEAVLAEIDADADRSISPAEQRFYSERVLKSIALDVDGVPLQLAVAPTAFPAVDAALRGEGTIRIRAVAPMPRLDEGFHHLRFRNTFRTDIGVYLANALVPARDRVTVDAQRRDVDQRELLVDYTLRGRSSTLARRLSAGIGGALIVFAGLWWRIREDR